MTSSSWRSAPRYATLGPLRKGGRACVTRGCSVSRRCLSETIVSNLFYMFRNVPDISDFSSNGCAGGHSCSLRGLGVGSPARQDLNHRPTPHSLWIVVRRCSAAREEIPYCRRRSLTIEGDPLLQKEISHYRRKSLTIEGNPEDA